MDPSSMTVADGHLGPIPAGRGTQVIPQLQAVPKPDPFAELIQQLVLRSYMVEAAVDPTWILRATPWGVWSDRIRGHQPLGYRSQAFRAAVALAGVLLSDRWPKDLKAGHPDVLTYEECVKLLVDVSYPLLLATSSASWLASVSSQSLATGEQVDMTRLGNRVSSTVLRYYEHDDAFVESAASIHDSALIGASKLLHQLSMRTCETVQEELEVLALCWKSFWYVTDVINKAFSEDTLLDDPLIIQCVIAYTAAFSFVLRNPGVYVDTATRELIAVLVAHKKTGEGEHPTLADLAALLESTQFTKSPNQRE